MELVPVICTQCGAKIEVDNTQEASICEYCGTTFITEKVKNNDSTNYPEEDIKDVSGDEHNYIILGQKFLALEKGKDAIAYADQVLEMNAQSSDAWILKMKAIKYTGTFDNLQQPEAVLYGNNAIKSSNNDTKVIDEVYEFFLERAETLMSIAEERIKDTEQIKKQKELSLSSMKDFCKKDHKDRDLYFGLTVGAINYKLSISEQYVAKSEMFQNRIVLLAEKYIKICEADVDRLAIYGGYLMPEAISGRETNLQLIKKGLPFSKTIAINDELIKKNNEHGCYIATCVYGSYDCPEVWTLRRFRDDTLNQSWYGRVFIKCYYAISPMLVKWFGNQKWFRTFWKEQLDKMVKSLMDRGVSNTRYVDKI